MFGWLFGKDEPAPVVSQPKTTAERLAALPRHEDVSLMTSDEQDMYFLSKEIEHARDDCVEQAEREIEQFFRHRGPIFNSEERQQMIELRAEQLHHERTLDLIAIDEAERAGIAQAFEMWEKDFDQRMRHQELVDAIERGNVSAKLMDFAKAHPILAGFFGADIIHRLNDK